MSSRDKDEYLSQYDAPVRLGRLTPPSKVPTTRTLTPQEAREARERNRLGRPSLHPPAPPGRAWDDPLEAERLARAGGCLICHISVTNVKLHFLDLHPVQFWTTRSR